MKNMLHIQQLLGALISFVLIALDQKSVRDENEVIGWAETGGGVCFFALNMDITHKNEARFRREITMQALKLKGLP